MKEGVFIKGKLQYALEVNKNIIKTKHNNRHVSVLNDTSYYLTRVPAVKRCRKTQQDCFINFNKTQIFQLVHAFVNHLIQENSYLEQVLHETQFQQNNKQTKIITTDNSIVSIDSTQVLGENVEEGDVNNNNVQINLITVDRVESKDDDRECDNLPSIDNMLQDNWHYTNKIINKNYSKKTAKSTKKISIMLQSDDLNLIQQTQHSSTLFSQQSLSYNISSIEIIQHQLTIKMIEKIYEQPQPFLINLSVCLMLKYLNRSKTRLDKKNVCWILSVGTIVAYKLYYDEPVEGLVQSFAQILKLSKENIVTLERSFLKGIDHQAVISSQQYHSTLYHIIKNGKQ